jgi:RNA recognition motif-containing protein
LFMRYTEQMMTRMANAPDIIPPSDQLIKTLWIGGLTPAIGQEELRDAFYAYGEVVNVRVIPNKGMGFVEFLTRASAEAAATALHNTLCIQNTPLKLNWASRREAEPDASAPDGAAYVHGTYSSAAAVTDGSSYAAGGYILPPPPGLPPGIVAYPGMAPVQQQPRHLYASMDPNRMGAVPKPIGTSSAAAAAAAGASGGSN